MFDAGNPRRWDTLVIADGFCGDVFATQQRLRAQLLDGNFIRHRRARDLAAHMLLNLDDLPACWSLATNWLRAELGCHRVDAGFGAQQASEYFLSYAEAKDTDYDVPTLGGPAVDNRDPVMQAMWLAPRPVIFADAAAAMAFEGADENEVRGRASRRRRQLRPDMRRLDRTFRAA